MLSEPTRVLCVDDHPIVRAGLRAMIESADGLTLVGEAGTVAQARELSRRTCPNMLLIDVRLPDGDGIEAASSMRRAMPDLAVIVLSSFAGDETVHRAVEAGAKGFVLKENAESELIDAIRTVASGRRYLHREAAALLMQYGQRIVLTPRERDVLGALARGLQNKEIGQLLGMTASTARTHVENILAKFACRDRQSAVAVAAMRGFVLDRSPTAP